MPNRSREKGNRGERAIVALLKAYGLDAYRVPLSGAARGFKDDVELRIPNRTLRIESKVRSKGFKNIYLWIRGADILVVKKDHEKPLAIIDLQLLGQILSQIHRSQTENVAGKTLLRKPLDTPPQEPRPPTIIKDPNLLSPNDSCLMA